MRENVDVIEALGDYSKLGLKPETYSFSRDDVAKIGRYSGGLDVAIVNALRAGYAIGYKRGRRVAQAGKD